MPRPLTRNQKRTLLAVADHHDRFHFPPTLREIQTHAGISSSSMAAYSRNRLSDEGLLTYHSDISRSVMLTNAGKRMVAELRVEK